ncbi:S1-C subfamily serine protease [Paenibacillus sp. DS2015]|uniref:S1C family serine protease n=1 Tax=Paenibacillus sp. DS2015 TaxID=3373917 RepID=UPI003D240C56
MNDHKDNNRSGHSNEELEQEMNKHQESSESGSSYYYSYGPFQSIGKDNGLNNEVDPYQRRYDDDVEITTPQPVRPLPSINSYRPTSGEQSKEMNNGNNGNNGSGGNGNWQYSKRPKSSFKSIAISFLAGMLVISGLMFTADYTNMFTGDRESVSVSTQEQAVNDVAPSTAVTTSLPLSKPTDVSTVVQEASPAVVKIATLVKSSSSRSGQQTNPNSTDPFSYFFGDQFGSGSSGNNNEDEDSSAKSGSGSTDQLVPYGIGSGFIYDKEGYILTNQHVVDGADVIQVTLEGNNKPYEAKLLGSSKELDLAVLKIEGSDFPIVPLGDSNSAKVGEPVVAIGNPQGFDHTVTAGVLSAMERSIDINEEDGSGTRKYEHLLQTDASINPGNSGGPLLNLRGQVIGINVAVSADAQGIGFAIPTSVVSEVVDKLESNQEIPKTPVPFIGASLMTMTDEVANQMGSTVKEGSFVSEVIYKSPAYVADLRPYDIIVGINGTKYPTSPDLIEFIQTKEVGTKITLNIVRDGKEIDLSVTIGNKNDFDTTTTKKQ